MPSDSLPTPMVVFIAIFCVLFVATVIRIAVFTARRRRILRSAGLSPMMAPVQMEAMLAQSALLSPPVGQPGARQAA
jgi:p-aminobenzoyl-glutamate transporter AbgT